MAVRNTTLERMAQVAKEYGQAFSDVVKGFADDGVGFTVTCKTLGFSEYTLWPYRDLFPKQAKRMKIERPWARELVQDRAVKVEGLRLTEISEKYGISRETVRRRYKQRNPKTIADLIRPYERKAPRGTTAHWKKTNDWFFRSKQ